MAEENMKDFEDEINRSFKVLKEGDILEAPIIGISDTEATVDLQYYTEGVIPLKECSHDPSFSIKNDLNIGDIVKVMVIDAESASGNVVLSMKAANDELVWDELQKDFEDHTVFSVKITEAVPAGVVGFVKGIRAFIPASKLALNYVEDTDSYVGMTVEAVILTVEPEHKKLVLSAKAIAKEQALAEKNLRIGRLMVGDIVEGTIERMESYGVFYRTRRRYFRPMSHFTDHEQIYQVSKRSLKMGEKVKAKILKIEGDRISLSIKALKEDEPDTEEETFDIPEEYSADSEESHDESPFAKLLQGIKL